MHKNVLRGARLGDSIEMAFHKDMKWFGLGQDMVQVGLLECVGFWFSCTRK
jgi:hypothetical protein